MRSVSRVALALAVVAAALAATAVAPQWLVAQDAADDLASPEASGVSASSDGLPEAPEAERVAFTHLTVADKLSNESVEVLLQDRFGFVWIGTADGLDRFDGYDIVRYERSPDSTSLSDNVVSALAEDASGALWVGTSRGLNRLDRETEQFQRFRAATSGLPSDDIVVLHADSSGALWVGTEGGGLGRYDTESGDWTVYRHDAADPASLPSDAVRALADGDEGALWVGTSQGVARLDPASGQFRSFSLGDDGFVGGGVSSLSLAESGGLWVGTLGAGLFRLDPASGAATTVDLGGLSASVVKSVYEDSGGTLWVGTLGDGLRQIPAGSPAPIVYRATEGDPDALIDDSVLDIMEDRQGVLWIATYGGVDRFDRARGTVTRYRYDPQVPSTIASNDVQALLVSGGGTLYVGTDGAVNVKSGGDAFRRLTLDASQAKATALLQARDGGIWAGATSGLYRVGSGGLESVAVKAPGEVLIVEALLEGRSGDLFIGTLGDGLVRFDPASGEATTYTHDPAATSSVAHDNVRALAQDARGDLWVGTQEGLCRLDAASGAGRFTCYRAAPSDPEALASGAIQALHIREADGSLWIGTSGGLHRLDLSAPEAGFSRFTQATSDLPGDAVLAIVEDGSGFLWLATNRGLTKFDPATSTFQQRTLGGEGAARTLGNAVARGPDGRLYFGGTNGVLAFDPTQLSEANPNAPDVVITEVLLANAPVEPGPESPLDAAAPAAQTLHLDHSQDDWITIAFAGLHFSDPARNSYRYKLEGVHDEWRGGLGDRDRTAQYNNLGPGRYTFRVQAANADGAWSPEGASLAIVVSPPWWRTSWAYLAYVGLIVFGLVRLDRWQRSRLLRQERERAERREQEIRAETAEAEARQAEADRQRAEAEARAARAEAEGK
ncbi:MAG: two-component regulator propeller domain-containing protein, partial [Bacteroidota bacterium]